LELKSVCAENAPGPRVLSVTEFSGMNLLKKSLPNVIQGWKKISRFRRRSKTLLHHRELPNPPQGATAVWCFGLSETNTGTTNDTQLN